MKQKIDSNKKPITYKNITILTTQVSTKHLNLQQMYDLLGDQYNREVIINFGNTEPHTIQTLVKPIIINKIESIKKAINKVETKRILLKKRVPVCKGYIFKNSSVYLITDDEDTLLTEHDLESIQFPAVFKKKAGSKGAGMLVVNNLEEMTNVLKNPIKYLGKFLPQCKSITSILSRYFLEEIFNKGKFNEVRMHGSYLLERVPVYYQFKHEIETSEGLIDASEAFYSNNGIIFETQKFSKTTPDGETIFGKNVSLGAAYWSRSKFHSLLPKYKDFDKIRKGCINAIKALNLDIAAVDIVFTRSGEFAILEVNTAPALFSDNDTRTLQCYNQAIPVIIEKKSVKNVF